MLKDQHLRDTAKKKAATKTSTSVLCVTNRLLCWGGVDNNVKLTISITQQPSSCYNNWNGKKPDRA